MLFSFLISDVYGYNLGEVSLLLIPGYIAAVIVGTLTGKIAKHLTSKQAITIALIAIVVSLLVPALLVDKGVVIFVISMILFGMAFALMYGPLVSTAIQRVPVANSGIGIGFYNLTINIAVPVGIAYTATLMKVQPDLLGGITDTSQASSYGSVLLILTGVAALGLVLYRVFIVVIERQGAEIDTPVESAQV